MENCYEPPSESNMKILWKRAKLNPADSIKLVHDESKYSLLVDLIDTAYPFNQTPCVLFYNRTNLFLFANYNILTAELSLVNKSTIVSTLNRDIWEIIKLVPDHYEREVQEVAQDE